MREQNGPTVANVLMPYETARAGFGCEVWDDFPQIQAVPHADRTCKPLDVPGIKASHEDMCRHVQAREIFITLF